jgi:hypothetical protein
MRRITKFIKAGICHNLSQQISYHGAKLEIAISKAIHGKGLFVKRGQ